MAIKPILFNTEMVRAILDGRKSCTRRVVKPQPTAHYGAQCIKPPYQPGDILYVRETWKCWRAHRYEATADIMFKADGDGVQLQFANGSTDSIDRFDYDKFVNKWFSHNGEWKPSIFMPKEAARIRLKVTNVRVERLQQITEVGIRKEGIEVDPKECVGKFDFISELFFLFQRLWDSTIKKSDLDRYGWDANPWVWVIEFERCEKPEGV